MKTYGIGDIDVADSVAVCEQKGLVPYIFLNPLDAAARHGIQPRFGQGYLPGLRIIVVIRIFVRFQIDRHIRLIEIIVGEKTLDDIALISQTHNKIVESVMGIFLHDMPQNRLSANFDHRLGFQMRFFADPRSESPCKNHYFHSLTPSFLSFFLSCNI